MALTLSSIAAFQKPTINFSTARSRCGQVLVARCELNESSSSADAKTGDQKVRGLEIGSPIVVIEAPKLLKTAASVPCLRANSGLVKPGDVGRIVSRKPKNVWAVRLNIGTYLIDEKCFKALELND